ncbi:MAG: DUF255 domain-containing protein [Planctomycetaceae bacterium]
MSDRRFGRLSGKPAWWLAGFLAVAVIPVGFWLHSQRPVDEHLTETSPDQTDELEQDQAMAHTNHLIDQTSPYLLQHAHNPVNWYPWGDEAFAKAKQENKPVFLSVGYSTCYWCHVMEVESFEDAEVAAVINKYFIAIKVDREERPDIDEQYMLATQLVTQRGGWPNSVWLTPDGKPWMAGTYYPKPRFIQILEQLAEVWRDRREEVDQQADDLANAVERMSRSGEAKSVELTPELTQQGVDKLVSRFDPTHGGFGGVPRFPPHGTLQLLMQHYLVTGQKSLLKPISVTLDAMWLGGMHDHIGGGFHRYATDAEWLLPHFEKMLYDNAQLMRSYADAYQITANERYRDAVADINRWVKREMTSPDGAFYSALDSGEVGREGEAYVWPMNGLSDVLTPADATLFATVYNFQPEGNFRDESTGERTGTNIPHLDRTPETSDGQAAPPDLQQAERLAGIREKLLEERQKRPQPRKDDKILASWNGLMIGSLAHAGRLLDEPAYVEAAAAAADFILDHMVRGETLLRTYRNGNAKLPGYLDDYVFFTEGLIELYRATENSRWLDEADRFATKFVHDFEDQEQGGFFFTSADHEDLMVRSRHLGGGGNMPNPNGVAAQVLIQLARLKGKPAYRESAKRTLESLSGLMAAQPHSTEHLLIATSELLADSESSSVAGTQPVDFSSEATDRGLNKRAESVSILVTALPAGVQAGDRISIGVTLEIDDGWHLYGENPQTEFLVPSTVSVAPNERFTTEKIRTPIPQSETDPILNETVNIYTGRIEFVIPVTISAEAAPGTTDVQIQIRTQACDAQRCLQPQTTTFRLPLLIKSP